MHLPHVNMSRVNTALVNEFSLVIVVYIVTISTVRIAIYATHRNLANFPKFYAQQTWKLIRFHRADNRLARRG